MDDVRMMGPDSADPSRRTQIHKGRTRRPGEPRHNDGWMNNKKKKKKLGQGRAEWWGGDTKKKKRWEEDLGAGYWSTRGDGVNIWEVAGVKKVIYGGPRPILPFFLLATSRHRPGSTLLENTISKCVLSEWVQSTEYSIILNKYESHRFIHSKFGS